MFKFVLFLFIFYYRCKGRVSMLITMLFKMIYQDVYLRTR